MIDLDNKDYLNAARSWETDAVSRARRSERIAWRVAAAGALVAAAAVGAVVGLTPLKTVDPFVIRVDKNTGATDVVTRVTEKSMSPDEAIDKYWVASYVRAREGYSDAFAYANYKEVDLLSSTDVGKTYYASFNPENPKSPFNTHGKTGKIDVKILSIAFLDQGVASVRYSRKDLTRGNTTESRWVATVGYRYEDPPLTEAERLVNPLGFQVVDYRTDSETTPTTGTALAGEP